MILFILATLLFLYLLFRLVLPSSRGRRGKAAMAVLLFIVAHEHLLKRLFFGSLPSPELPALVLMLQGWLFTSLILLFLLVLLRDICRLAGRLCEWFSVRLQTRLRARFPERSARTPQPALPGAEPEEPPAFGRRRFLTASLGAIPAAYGAQRALLSGLVMLPTAYGVREAVQIPEIHETEVFLPKLPKELDGLTLAQISDMHVSPLLREDWVKGLVERVNSLDPDLIVFTGDMVDGLPARRAESMAPLRNLRARHGIFACAGNHEYYSDYKSWMERFPDLGITMLLNSHASLAINGRELILAGLTDMAAARFGLPEPDLAAALRGAPEQAPRILLDHRPGNAPVNALSGVDLQLSGHTHGGHAYGMTRLVAAFNRGYVHGWYRAEGMPLYVSAGAGLWNGFPIRVGVPPEIARITLRAGA